MKFALCALLLSLARAGDIGEKLAAETAADDAASENAKCWCKDLQETLASRAREAEFELRHLDNQKSKGDTDNNVLRLEVAAHQAEASQHQQSLDSNAAIANKTQLSYEEGKAFHETALKSVRKAMDALPDGKGGDVRGALRGLEQSFAKKLDEVKDKQGSKLAGLREAKAEMLRLAREAEGEKTRRLADGVRAVEQASIQYDRFTAQSDADRALNSAMQSRCTTLSSEAVERKRLRQQAIMAVSQAKVNVAEAAAAKASSKLVLFSSAASKSSRILAEDDGDALVALMARSSEVQGEMAKMLSAVVLDAHLLDSRSGVDAAVKAALAKLGQEAGTNLRSLPHLFDAVRAAGGKSSEADRMLVRPSF